MKQSLIISILSLAGLTFACGGATQPFETDDPSSLARFRIAVNGGVGMQKLSDCGTNTVHTLSRDVNLESPSCVEIAHAALSLRSDTQLGKGWEWMLYHRGAGVHMSGTPSGAAAERSAALSTTEWGLGCFYEVWRPLSHLSVHIKAQTGYSWEQLEVVDHVVTGGAWQPEFEVPAQIFHSSAAHLAVGAAAEWAPAPWFLCRLEAGVNFAQPVFDRWRGSGGYIEHRLSAAALTGPELLLTIGFGYSTPGHDEDPATTDFDK